MTEPTDQTPAPTTPLDDRQLESAVEALLLMSAEAMSTTTLAEACKVPVPRVEQACRALASFYDETGRGFELRHVGGGWRLWTRPEHAELIQAWVLEGQHARLSQAALETLAVIAYLQPISRSRVSAVRGVSVDGVMRTLMTRGLIEEVGSDDQGGATLFATTDHFLERMGLESLDDLPALAPHLPTAAALEDELAQLAASAPSAPGEVASGGDSGSEEGREPAQNDPGQNDVVEDNHDDA